MVRQSGAGVCWHAQCTEFRRRFVATFGVYDRGALADGAVLGPAYSAVVSKLIAWQGRASFGNDDIVRFLFSPIGMLTTVVVGTLTWFAQSAELAGMMIIGRDSLQGRDPSPWRVLRGIIRALPRLLTLCATAMDDLLGPRGAFCGIDRAHLFLLWSQQDLNFLVQKKPPSFWAGAGLAGVVVVFYALLAGKLFVKWIFATPISLFEGTRGGEALKTSAIWLRGQSAAGSPSSSSGGL